MGFSTIYIVDSLIFYRRLRPSEVAQPSDAYHMSIQNCLICNVDEIPGHRGDSTANATGYLKFLYKHLDSTRLLDTAPESLKLIDCKTSPGSDSEAY